MATPSSSATSPSPPIPYLPHTAPAQQASLNVSANSLEQDTRKKAVKKFLARAEVSNITRGLRARLAYASYKATHNISHVPLRDLEAQSQSQTASFYRTIAAKRRVAGLNNYYNNPATQGPSNPGAGSLRRGGAGAMPPPASPRTTMVNGSAPNSSYNDSSGSRNPQAPTLYSSILAPPPTKQARTIHNPNDPPVPAPTRPTQSPNRSRVSKPSPRTEPSRSQTKSRHPAKKTTTSPDRRRTKGGSIDKGKRKQRAEEVDVDVDGDVDMKAAATLTSLLMHNRPSIAGSTSSPRSSIDGSEVGSAYSFSHFNQSAARSSAPNQPVPLTAAPSTSTIVVEPSFRSKTPSPSGGSIKHQNTTPHAAPTDSEAANLMLFLATSPSPARPASKDSKDLAAYRALSGGSGPLRSKGRVLFPSTSAADSAPSGHEDVSAASGGTSYGFPGLTRGGDTSFTSSISSIGTELGDVPKISGGNTHRSSQSLPSIPMSGSLGVSQLLPPVPLPLSSAPGSPSGRRDHIPRPNIGGPGMEFNFHEFINASPSSPSRHGHTSHKSLGLRADVGRRLFEEEQIRHAHAVQAAAAAAAVGSQGPRQDERTLGAGIDLIQS